MKVYSIITSLLVPFAYNRNETARCNKDMFWHLFFNITQITKVINFLPVFGRSCCNSFNRVGTFAANSDHIFNQLNLFRVLWSDLKSDLRLREQMFVTSWLILDAIFTFTYFFARGCLDNLDDAAL